MKYQNFIFMFVLLICLTIINFADASYRHRWTVEQQALRSDVVIIGKILDISEGALTGRNDKERIMFLRVQVKDELKYHTYKNKNILILFTCSYRLTSNNLKITSNNFKIQYRSSADLGLPDRSDINKEYLFFIDMPEVFNTYGGYMPYYTFNNSYQIKNGKVYIPKDIKKNKWNKESIINVSKSIKKKYGKIKSK